MKFSYNWLNDYFDGKLPEAEKLATEIGLHSFELEGVEKLDNGDSLIDWDILPNRSSDCLCYDGMAQEISSILNIPIKKKSGEKKEFDKNLRTTDFINLEIEDKNKVLRATKRIAVEVKVGPSPKWLVEKLENIGQKSINNVVDVTNYVMWVTGQPVHAFDYDKLTGKEPKNIYIKSAENKEKIEDLTRMKHELDETILVISDGQKSLDIAGIKGGNVSGIDENTTKIMMSAVNFEYENIRNTSKKLKLQTDASKRYENEIPLNKVILAQDLFGSLLQELAEAKVSEEIIDSNPNIPEKKEIEITMEDINLLLGLELTEDDILNIFKRQKFNVQKKENGTFLVQPTIERLDLNIKEDLVEEIGRIYGYENIPATFPEEGFEIPKINKLKETKNIIGDTLKSLGFFEVFNRTIIGDNHEENTVKLTNSLNSKATTLRTNLIDKLQEKTSKNFTHQNEPKLFEIGKIFNWKNGEITENYSWAGIIGKTKIKEKQKENVFLETKGILEKVFEMLEIDNIKWEETANENYLTEIKISENRIGFQDLNHWEINLEELVKNTNHQINYKKPSKYPKIERDIAFWVPLEFQVHRAKEIIKPLLPIEAIDLELFDIYKDLEKNRKSFAFKIKFQSKEKTLSDDFANKIMNKIYKTLEKNNFEIR